LISSVPAGVKLSHYTLTNKGLHIETSFCDIQIEGLVTFARLNCSEIDGEVHGQSLALPLVRSQDSDTILSRSYQTVPVLVPSELFTGPSSHVYIHRYLAPSLYSEFYYASLIVQCSLFGDPVIYRINEFYPSPWRRVMKESAPHLIYLNSKNIDTNYQSMIFLVENDTVPNYAVWLEYKFRLDFYQLMPENITYRAALMEKTTTLAEVLIRNKSSLKKALSWQEVLNLGDAELRFELDKSRNRRWIVDIRVNKK